MGLGHSHVLRSFHLISPLVLFSCLANFFHPRGIIFHHTLSLLMLTVCVTPFLALGNARLTVL